MMGLLTLEKKNPRDGRGSDELGVGNTVTFVSKEQGLK